MPEKACTNCGTPHPGPGSRCNATTCRIDRGSYHQRKRTRAAVIRRDGLVCWICHLAIEPSDLHVDHVVPLADGGPDTVANQRPAHARCNLERGRGAEKSRGARK